MYGSVDSGLLSPQDVLQHGLSSRFQRSVRIACMDGQRKTRSTNPIDRLCVTLDSGERLQVIFKRLRHGPEPKGHRREVLIYRRLLAGQRFGAPEVYASLYDVKRSRYWLFLEDVGDWTMQHADRRQMCMAICWLAEMHASYMAREADLRALDCLDEHGAEYFEMVARTARQNLRLAQPSSVLGRFDALMERYDSLVEYLTGQTRTLVHGDLFPKNLVLQPGGWIRPIDWEHAGIGLPAWDLARLVDGWGRDKQHFVTSYLTESSRLTDGRLDPQTFERAFLHCEIVNVLWHFRVSPEQCADAEVVNKLLRKVETTWRILDRQPIHV